MSNSHFQPPNVSTAASVMGDIVGDWFKLWNSKLQVLRKTQKCLLKIQYLPEHIHFSTWGGIQLLPMSKLKTMRHTSTTHVKVKDNEADTYHLCQSQRQWDTHLPPMSKLKTVRHTPTNHVKVKDSEIYTPTTHVKVKDNETHIYHLCQS